MRRYFEAVDAYGEPSLWECSPDRMHLPRRILSRYNIAHEYRDRVWPLIVEAVTTADPVSADLTKPETETQP